MIPNRQRLAAVAVLGERETQRSAVQRLALVDAAAWWLSEPNGGEQLAYALLAASCSAEVTTEHVYLALITPSLAGEDARDFFLVAVVLQTSGVLNLRLCYTRSGSKVMRVGEGYVGLSGQ